jgi:hypothetical protein
MAKRDPPHGCDTGFVTLFARAPQLCAGTLAALGSALWLNLVAPFAGPVASWSTLVLVNGLAATVVAALAVLVTTAGTLLAADWRADAASRQAWAEFNVAAAEHRLPVGRVVQPHIDPRYLTWNDIEALRSVFRAHRFTPLAPAPDTSTHTPAAGHATRIVAASGGSIQAPAASKAEPRLDRRSTTTVCSSDVAAVARPHRAAANASFDQQSIVVATWRARPPLRAEPAPTVARRVANGGAWSEWLAHERCILAQARPDGHGAHIVVLSGDRGDRDRHNLPDPSTCDWTARLDAPPSCRGPPTTGGQRTRSRQTRLVAVSVEKPGTVGAAGALRPADPIVHDNLRRQVPVCAAELDVIETYLDQVLREVLATPGSGRDSQTS